MSSIVTIRDKNGRAIKFRARYRDPDGNSREKWFTLKEEATQFLATVEVDKARGTYIAPEGGKEKLGDYARQWADAQPWRQNTRNRAETILEQHVIKTFRTRELRSILRSDVQAWVGSMSASGLKASTVAGYYRVLASIMRAAVDDRKVLESPCRGIRLPRKDTTHASLVPLTTEQVHALADAVAPYRAALVLASAGLALRQGEACGLTLDRIDFLRRKVTIDRQMLTVAGVVTQHGPVKTEASVRSLALPDSVAVVLAEHIRQFPPGPSGLLFTTDDGLPLSRSKWSGEFSRAAKSVGLDVGTHSLRHHGASLFIAAGCSVKAVQSFLGHATAAETLDTYGHLWADDEDRLRAAVDNAWAARRGAVVGLTGSG